MRKLLYIMILAPLAASAQTLTIDECQRLAEENYPLIRRYGLLEQTSQLTIDNIGKGWLPQISLGGQATYQSKVVTLPDALNAMMAQYGQNAEGIRKDQYKVVIDVQQTVYDGGAISAQRNVADAQLKADKARNAIDLYALRDRINQLCFSLLYVKSRLDANSQLQTLLQANEDKLDAMLQNGVAMESDRNAVRAERLAARQSQTQLEGQREALGKVLSIFCAKEVTDIERPDASGIVPQKGAVRPELDYFDSQINLANQREAALKSGLMPKLSLFAQGYYGYPGMNMYEDMFQHRWSLNGLVGARLTWNISSFYTNRNSRRKLASQRLDIEAQRDVFLLNQSMQNAQEETAVLNCRKVMEEDDEIISLREDVRKASEAKLEHGIVDVSELIEKITRENQARISRSSHEIDLLQHIYNRKYIRNE